MTDEMTRLLAEALEMDGTERTFRDVMADGGWSKAQDDGWMRANVWHLLEVLDRVRAALAEPERCPVCAEPVKDRFEHADGSSPTGHRILADPEP